MSDSQFSTIKRQGYLLALLLGGSAALVAALLDHNGVATAPATRLMTWVLVGGLTDFADGNSAVLVRGAEGGKQYSVRLRDLIKRGEIAANVDVKPGDVLIIPQSWF